MHTEDVKSILAYALLDRIWIYLNRNMPLGDARLDALASVKACENALLENWPTFCDRFTIANFNTLTSKGWNLSDAQSDRIRADIARVSPETIAFDGLACDDCIQAIANDNYCGMSDAQAELTRAGIARLGVYLSVGDEAGFTHRGCDVCCDGLAGNKHEVCAIARLPRARSIASDEELQAEIDALSLEELAVLRTLNGYTPELNEAN